MQCACAVLSSVDYPALQYFSTLSHKRHHFSGREGGGGWNKLLNIKCLLISYTTLFEIFLIHGGIKRNIITNVHTFSCKSVPLQAWSSPEGSRKLRFPDYVTTAQDGGKVVSLTYRPPLPQEILLVLIAVRG